MGQIAGPEAFSLLDFSSGGGLTKGVTPAENHFLILSLSRKEVGGFMIASSEF